MRGTRIAVLAVAAFGAIVASASAAGETYVVIQCHPQNLASPDAEVIEPRAYGITKACADPERDNAIEINSRLNAGNGREGSVRWIAPEETAFVRVRLDAKLRRGNGHYSRLFMADANGRQTHRIATGDGSPGSFQVESWAGGRQQQLVATLGCDEPAGCPQSDVAKTYVRAVRMTLADYDGSERWRSRGRY